MFFLEPLPLRWRSCHYDSIKQLADTFLKRAPPGLFGGVVSAFLHAIFAATISLTSSIMLRSPQSDKLYFHTILAISLAEISRLRPWSDLSRVR